MPTGDSSELPRVRDLGESRAFREASLHSEVRRAYAFIGVVLLVAVVVFVRPASNPIEYRVRTVGLIGLAVLIAVNVGVLRFVRWAVRHEKTIPAWFNVITVVIECLVPTGIMVSHIMSGTVAPYAALSAPPIFGYGLLICMTPLRLRPGLCVLAGVVCAAGYGAVLAFVIYGMGIGQPTTGLPRLAYVNSTFLIFITALAAAWVARELRTHMEAALDEAETRRKMDRIEQDLVIARSIQRALLPRDAPNIAGFEIAGWNRPADQTGGDYYDWQMLPDGNWIVTVADVCGHGIGPALVTAACRAYVRASAGQRTDLASLASRVNCLLAEDLLEGRFVTMVNVLISPQADAVALLSAGHGPIALYIGATGVVEDIIPQDLPLAVDRDANFGPAQTIVMGPGDILALVTDGFIEWSRRDPQGQRDEFGISRLRESLCRHAHLPAKAMIEAITADVAAFADPAPQQDDLTMVIIRRAACAL
jgi:serine phosphatase RsbU (regulator of sigma subunit)